MEDNKWLLEKIDDFILGKLDTDTAQIFREALQKDDKLMEELNIRKAIYDGLETHRRRNLRLHIKGIHKEMLEELMPQTGAKKRVLWPYWAAASIVIFAIAFAWWFKSSQPQNPEDLYFAYFEPYDASLMQRTQNDTALLLISNLYKNKKYKQVLPLMEAQLNNPAAASSTLILATGITYLELDQPRKALDLFEQIDGRGDFNFADEVKWYSALAYLKAGEMDRSKTYLQQLSSNKKNKYYKNAKELLNDL